MKKIFIFITAFIIIFSHIPAFAAVNWEGNVVISGNTFIADITIGAHRTATDGYDTQWDVNAMSPGGEFSVGAREYIFPYFLHTDWSGVFSKFSQDIRSPVYGSGLKEWVFEVYSTLPDNTVITIDLSDIVDNVPSGSDIRFADNNGLEFSIFSLQFFTYLSTSDSTEQFAVRVYNVPYTGPPVPVPDTMPEYIADAMPTFGWGAVTNASMYHFQASDNPAFIPVLIDDSTVTGNGYTPSNRFRDGRIYWRVSGIDSNGNESPYSETGSIVIDTKPPEITNLSIPNNVFGSSQAFYFTTDMDAAVSVTVDTAAVAGTTLYSQQIKRWKSIISGLVEGRNSIVITAVDPAGNTHIIETFIRVMPPPLYENDDIDTDGDGMPDGWEIMNGFDPDDPSDGEADEDEDGLSNADEFINNTDPYNADTDNDGISDGLEVLYGTDPTDPLDYPGNTGNAKPAADAGPNQESDPAVITLDGSNSHDFDGDTLVYLWSQDPANPEQASGFDAAAASPSFILKKGGTYIFGLIVNDGTIDSDSDFVEVAINNISPTADAYLDQTVNTGTEVVLDGTGSSDANGDTLAYLWEQSGEPKVVLTGKDTASPAFTPTESGVYTFRLIVSDPEGVTGSDDVNITANLPNIVPTADAGQSRTVRTGDTVNLDGTGSSDGGDGPDHLTFSWAQVQPDIPRPALSDANITTPTFTPPESGVYIFELVVYDGEDYSATDTVNITVNGPNIVPIADAGKDRTVTVEKVVTLGCGKSYDKDNGPDPLTCEWTQTRGTTVSLAIGTETPHIATFTPIVSDRLVFSLKVYDGKDRSEPDEVAVIVNGDNNIPIADAGKNIKGMVKERIILDGTGSYDPDGDDIISTWTQAKGPCVTLSDLHAEKPSFVPIAGGKYEFELVVKDTHNAASGPARVAVTVHSIKNRIPVADAGKDQIVKAGAEVVLDGTGSYDPDGDPLTYQWRVAKGLAVELSGEDTATPSFTPHKKGAHIFKLLVNDGKEDSEFDMVKIHVIGKNGDIKKIYRAKENIIRSGELSAIKGTEVVIPKGAIDKDETDIGISDAGADAQSFPDDITPVGGVVDLAPDGMQFVSDITIRLPFDINQMTGNDISGLMAYTFNEETRTWDIMERIRVDRENNYVHISARHFSLYRLGTAGEPVSEGDEESGGACFIGVINK